jgi:Cu(I)/Ag(I) efflux system protein CusF
MRKLVLISTGLVALTAAAAVASSHIVDGQVTKIDQSAGKITIKHGPIKSLDMEGGMTMVFRVQDPAALKQVKPGDKIKFEASRVNGQITASNIQKAK